MASRRGFMLGAAAAAVLPWDLALAQSATGIVTVGMTASAVPLSNGCPDQGAEGQRFMGYTLYDALVNWDLSHADKAAVLAPGVAASWATDPADPKKWIFTLRQGVKFHDGKTMTADDIVFSFDRAFKRGDPAFDPRANAQVALRVPTLASWGADGADKFWLTTTIVDSTIPYCVAWVGITHRGAWEAAGKDWNAYLSKAVGTGPWKLETFNIRERCVMDRFADYWDPKRVPKAAKLVLLPLPEANTRVAALRSGQINFAEAPPPGCGAVVEGGWVRYRHECLSA